MGDLLFELTNWLRTTFLLDLALWTSDTWLSQLMVTNFWAIPTVQVIHILAVAGSFAAVLMINARMFGVAGHATMAETSARYIKVLWWSLAVLVVSGFFMIVGEPVREMINPIFWIKMILVVVGVLVVISFAKTLGRQASAGDAVAGGAKATGIFLVVLWCVIILCGRWIAYAPV